ncbi:hypothetical protein [Streptomyces sp. NPDC020965]|uniref:hypothetical protein n=1 Tax=Streptomyces sp. NPDC020965 TaxID=3365105 RepID=UPI0037B2D027
MFRGRTTFGRFAFLAAAVLTLQLFVFTAALAPAHAASLPYTASEVVTCGEAERTEDDPSHHRCRDRQRVEEHGSEAPPHALCRAYTLPAAPGPPPTIRAGGLPPRADSSASLLQVFRC